MINTEEMIDENISRTELRSVAQGNYIDIFHT